VAYLLEQLPIPPFRKVLKKRKGYTGNVASQTLPEGQTLALFHGVID